MRLASTRCDPAVTSKRTLSVGRQMLSSDMQEATLPPQRVTHCGQRQRVFPLALGP